LNARFIAKGYLAGLREQSLNELVRSGTLNPPHTDAMEQQVIPWLMDRIVDFLREDAATIEGSSSVVNEGIIGVSNGHASAIQARRDAIKKAEADKVEARKQNEIRKQQRREAREKRAKDE